MTQDAPHGIFKRCSNLSTKSTRHTGNAMQRLLSQQNATPAPPNEFKINGMTYKLAKTIIGSATRVPVDGQGSLIDSGANGGLSGADVRVIADTGRTADVYGITNNDIVDVPICTVAGVIETTSGPVVGMFHQYAHQGTGQTIHSVSQLASFGIDIDEKPYAVGGKQQLVTPDGYIIPLAVRQGLAYMDMRQPTDKELDELPTIIFTKDDIWDPTILDSEVPDSIEDLPRLPDKFKMGAEEARIQSLAMAMVRVKARNHFGLNLMSGKR